MAGDFDVEKEVKRLSFGYRQLFNACRWGRVAWVIMGKRKRTGIACRFWRGIHGGDHGWEAMQAVLGFCDAGEWLFGGSMPAIDGPPDDHRFKATVCGLGSK
jgi:hypothetical protein